MIATRPVHQNIEWMQRLRQSGYDVIEAPLLDIRAVNDAELAVATTKILNLDEYASVIFVSQNAVDYALPLFDQYWPALPSHIKWFSVGARTAQHLQNMLNQYFDLVPEVLADHHAMNSEALMTRPEFQSVQNDKVLIVRGLGGRPYMAECLTQRGATVHHCELYERALPDMSKTAFEQLGIDANDILPVFSAESLNNFVTLSGKKNSDHISVECSQLRLVVPSERVAKSAAEIGFSHVCCAKNATAEAMLAAIASVASSERVSS